jgi:hypothetical protein
MLSYFGTDAWYEVFLFDISFGWPLHHSWGPAQPHNKYPFSHHAGLEHKRSYAICNASRLHWNYCCSLLNQSLLNVTLGSPLNEHSHFYSIQNNLTYVNTAPVINFSSVWRYRWKCSDFTPNAVSKIYRQLRHDCTEPTASFQQRLSRAKIVRPRLYSLLRQRIDSPALPASPPPLSMALLLPTQMETTNSNPSKSWENTQ